ncbi:type II toxin-antitoxin system death-on-curing family toxin [Actinosynnema pretiosum]|uniref:Death-on-curing protein n=1 Tax=Actinosynnema pretiosum TaxID=42197 RepID=A0A290ZCC9_9PSEU|nr:Fic family protein [Actinosynnema pretiosum]ATE56646.1 death-on-curing protein [Actinosynnema pretiosum]
MSEDFEALTPGELLEIAEALVGGGAPVRSTELLESAAARPATTVLGEHAYPDVWAKAGALMESLGRNHPLVDGNKRLSWNATWVFLGVNGHPLAEDLDVDVAEEFVHAVVTGQLTTAGIADGLRRFASR